MACRVCVVMVVATVCLLGLACARNPSEKTGTHTQPPPLAIGSERIEQLRSGARTTLELLSGNGQLGGADFGDRKSCTFTVRNNSSKLLLLSIGEKSCSCAGVRLEPAELGPGQTTNITLLWSPQAEALETTTVRLWADLQDQLGQHKLRLEATGQLEPKVLVNFPRGSLDFGKLDLSELTNPAKHLIVEVYSRQQTFSIKSVQLTLPGMEMCSAYEPLGSDRLAQLEAHGGYRIVLRPTERLPAGRFQGQLLIGTSLRAQPLALDYHGNLETGSISLSHDRIDLPPRLQVRQGYRIPPITLTMRQGKCDRCEIQSIAPAFLQVKLTKTSEKTWRLEMNIPNSPEELRKHYTDAQWQQLRDFGFEAGHVTLQLDHPEIKSISIPISGSMLQFN